MRRGFTLIELMVASVIAFTLVAAAAALASAMANNVTRGEEQADLGTRSAIAHAFLQTMLAGAAYDWNTSESVSATTSTGSFGTANCTSGTGMCPSATELPLKICKSSTVSAAVCDAPVTTEADAIVTYIPRDPVIEAMTVVNGGTSALPVDLGTLSCNTVTNQQLVVSGTNSNDWATNDLVLVSKSGHTTIGRILTNLAAGTGTTRDLTVEFAGGLDGDDGGVTGCSVKSSLKSAAIFRITQVILKLDESTTSSNFRSLVMAKRNTSADGTTFVPIITNIDDFQARFDIVRVTTANAASFCTSDTSDVFLGGTTACSGERLNAAAGTNLNRVVGLKLALSLRTAVETENRTVTVPVLFDRASGSISPSTDKRLHRVVNVYVGLPNATNF